MLLTGCVGYIFESTVIKAYAQNNDMLEVLDKHLEGLIIWKKEDSLVFCSSKAKKLLCLPTNAIIQSSDFLNKLSETQFSKLGEESHIYFNDML